MYSFGRKSSGVFIPSAKGGFDEAKDVPENHSIHMLTTHFGYNNSQIEIIFSTERNVKVSNIALEVFTRNVVYAMTDKKTTFITERDIKKTMGDFSVPKYYDSIRIKEILEEGIESESFTVEFLARVLNMKNLSRNGMFYSNKIKTYLYFTNGILSNFQYDDGLAHYARHLQKANKTVFDQISKGAIQYRADDDFLKQKEINIQAEAWAAIPNAFGNEYIPLHTYQDGFVNLHMIRVTHYKHPITLSGFMELNHGRFQVVRHDEQETVLQLNRFRYRFSIGGQLLDCELTT